MKVFVFDLDKTILVDDHNIHPKNIEAIEKLLLLGKEIVFASGRMLVSIQNLLKRYFQKDFPLIAYNGCVVWIPGQGKILDGKIDCFTASKVILELRERGVHRQVYVNDELVSEEDNEYIRSYAKHSEVPFRLVDDLLKVVETGATKILAIGDSETLNEISLEMRTQFHNLSIFKSFDTYLDFVPKEYSKGKALQLLSKYNGWHPDDIVAFGDNDNDIPLLQEAGIGVAVDNATDALKEVADKIVPSNIEGGPGIFVLDMLDSFE